MGDPLSLDACLSKVEKAFLDEIKSRKGEFQARTRELQQGNLNFSAEIKANEKEAQKRKSRIDDLKDELGDIAVNPEKYHIESEFNTFGYHIGAILLIFLTLYLFLFYSSATYSAFFKNLGEELAHSIDNSNDIENVFRSVFDPSAFKQASEKGLYGLVFIFLAPFLFLGVGFTLYAVSRNKSYTEFTKKIVKAAIVLLILIIDIIIAYKISQEIYEAKFMTGNVIQLWQWSMVFYDVNFYLVIIAGFAAYIIWGFLLEYVSQEFENSRPYIAARRKREGEITKLDREIKELEEKNKSLRTSINVNNTEIAKLERMLDAKEISLHEMFTTLDTFFSGWTSWINTLNQPDSSERIQRGSTVLSDFKAELPKRYQPSDSVSEIFKH
jgi:peptidoglycan hydrolase CwlO-like protein